MMRSASPTNAPTTDVVVHDFSGHPFQAELSRKLAGRGLRVEHLSTHQYVSGKGHLDRQPGDPKSLRFSDIELHLPFQKYAPWARIRWERAYGRAWVDRLRDQAPRAVIASNIPLFSLWVFSRYAKRAKIPWILWHQDIYSFGMADEVRRRFPRPLASLGARILHRMEATLLRRCAHIVAIGDAFTEVYDAWGISPDKVSVIPNWAPLDKIFPVERRNRRSALLFPEEPEVRLVYAGTLGRKHNPGLLSELMLRLRDGGLDASMAVVSEGEGARDVADSAATAEGLIDVFDFQPADYLPDVLSSADVLIALLEPDATKFSIPSKVLSYMAAGRPIVGLMPSDNPAAVDITAAGGFVAPPTIEGVESAAAWIAELSGDQSRIEEIGKSTRHRAEELFDADHVAYQFARVLASISGSPEATAQQTE